MAAGKESRRKTRPTRAGFQMLHPSPPKLIFPIPMAMIAPITTIQSGRIDGRLKASSMPVIRAEPFVSVDGRWSIYLVISHSVRRHAVTLTSVTQSAGSPKVQIATARAGIMAITTFHMQRSMLPEEWICGESDMVSLFIIIFSCVVPVCRV